MSDNRLQRLLGKSFSIAACIGLVVNYLPRVVIFIIND